MAARLLVGYSGLSALCILLTGSRSAFVGLCAGAHRDVPLEISCQDLSACDRRGAVDLAESSRRLAEPILDIDRSLVRPAQCPGVGREPQTGLARWDSHLERLSRPVAGPAAFAQARGFPLESHHLYGQVLGELGTLGAIAFAMIVFAFFANHRQLARLCQIEPAFDCTFSAKLTRSVTLAVVLLLVMGFGGHNLYRYTWLWFGAFQAAAIRFLVSGRESFACACDGRRLCRTAFRRLRNRPQEMTRWVAHAMSLGR